MKASLHSYSQICKICEIYLSVKRHNVVGFAVIFLHRRLGNAFMGFAVNLLHRRLGKTYI